MFKSVFWKRKLTSDITIMTHVHMQRILSWLFINRNNIRKLKLLTYILFPQQFFHRKKHYQWLLCLHIIFFILSFQASSSTSIFVCSVLTGFWTWFNLSMNFFDILILQFTAIWLFHCSLSKPSPCYFLFFLIILFASFELIPCCFFTIIAAKQ